MKEKFEPLSLQEYMGSKPIKVVNSSPSYPIQKELFNYVPNKVNYGLRTRIGTFYEILTSAIFGGKWLGTSNSSNNGNGLFQPDVMSRDTIIESKSVCWKEALKLVDFQLDQYLLQQCTDFYQNSRRIFFSIFKYNVKSPLSYFKNFKGNHLEEMVKTLAENTSFLMFLPFSVVSALHTPRENSSEEKKAYFSRYEDPRFDPLTRLKATGMKDLLLFPEKVLEIYGINPKDYKIVKTKLPKSVKINKNKINSFPILFIEDLDYDSWLKMFKEENKDKVRFIQSEEKKKRDYWTREQGCSDVNEERLIIEEKNYQDEIPF
jgi:hypothetical protein